MAENTKIEWCDHTFNPWLGCAKVSPGCAHCYAEALMDLRYRKVKWGINGTRVKTSPYNWKKPIKWNDDAERLGIRRRVFCASLADVFEDWSGQVRSHRRLPIWSRMYDRPAKLDDLRRELFALIDATPSLDWLLLTKRPENIERFWPRRADVANDSRQTEYDYFRQNVWLGASAEDQLAAESRIPALMRARNLVPILFLSCEPLLQPIDLFLACPGPPPDNLAHLNWVIVGGESGPFTRPMAQEWAISLRDQCEQAGVRFFFKQAGGRIKSRLLDGREHNAIPSPALTGIK